MGRTSSARGFTLIELMITVAIIAIIAAVALPSYFGSVRKSRRADAINVMSQVAQAQERVRANNPTYSNDFGTSWLSIYTTAASGVTSLSQPYYVLSVPSAASSAYTIQAVAQNAQSSDTRCAAMQMRMASGVLTYVSSTSAGTIGAATSDPNRCWAR
jgi:type IV pilus assembly protein PilE